MIERIFKSINLKFLTKKKERMCCCLSIGQIQLLQQNQKKREKQEMFDQSVISWQFFFFFFFFPSKVASHDSSLQSTFSTFGQRTGPSPKLRQRNLPGRLAEPERAGGQEEQIASALHHHMEDWPERGLCLPKGRLEWHGLVALGGMLSSGTGTRVAWEAGSSSSPI